jgi:hypothetical protein
LALPGIGKNTLRGPGNHCWRDARHKPKYLRSQTLARAKLENPPTTAQEAGSEARVLVLRVLHPNERSLQKFGDPESPENLPHEDWATLLYPISLPANGLRQRGAAGFLASVLMVCEIVAG